MMIIELIFYKIVASEIIGSVPTRNYSVDDVRKAVRSQDKSSTTEKDIVKWSINKIISYAFAFKNEIECFM